MYELNTFCKMFNLLGQNVSSEFPIGGASSKMESQPSITPLLHSDGSEEFTYFMASWTVKDSDSSGVSGIYSSLISIAQTTDSTVYVINATVVDGGIDVYDWTPSDGSYPNPYRNHQVDSTYLMTNYVLLVWCSCVASKRSVHAAIYYIDPTMNGKGFVNVFDDYTVDIPVHGVLDTVNVTNPTVNTVTCYGDDDGMESCDISICYQYEGGARITSSDSKTFCSLWTVTQGDGSGSRNISMNRYYENDIEMTSNVNHSYFPVSGSWDRVFEDIRYFLSTFHFINRSIKCQ